MKISIRLKTISLFLLVVMVFTVLASCKVEDTGSKDTSKNSDTVTTGIATETTYPAPVVADYTGHTFNMLTIGNSLWVPLYFSDVGKETGELINDALYKREQKIEDTYKCDLNVIIDTDAHTAFENAYLGQESICDILLVTGSNSMTLATKGYLYDINTVEEFNLEMPWWDQRIQQEYLIGEKLFTIDGEFSVRDDLRTMTVVYNKDIYNDLGYNTDYGTPYDMVANKNWTYEKMMQMIDGISKNLDSDPTMTEDDSWGMLSELTAPYYFFLGSGKKIIQNNNGQLELNIKDSSAFETFFDIVSDTMTMSTNSDILVVNNGKVIKSDAWTVAVEMFKSNQALFRSTTLSAVNGLLSMESDYGLLPVPAYYENQDEYYCWVSGSSHTPITVPKNTPDIARTAVITEAISYHSMFSGLTEAFYDQLGEARLCRSDDDIKMLNIIFASKTYDIDQTCKISGIEPAMYTIARSEDLSSLSSKVQSQKSSSELNLSEFIGKIIAKNP